jgi:predicted hotdog family 3-hydroxylacyl-ACP dehydratase
VTAAPLGRAWLLANLPHQGPMNLLDEIVAWDDASIRAVARNHRSTAHPLRRNDELPAVCGIEYGAQAAAAHGALASREPSRAGLLASVRSVVMHARRLDDVAADLDVLAERIGGDESGVLYRFEVGASGRLLVEGRVAVAFAR